MVAERASPTSVAHWSGSNPNPILSYPLGCATLDPIRRPNSGLRGEHNRTLSRGCATAFGWVGPTCREGMSSSSSRRLLYVSYGSWLCENAPERGFQRDGHSEIGDLALRMGF